MDIYWQESNWQNNNLNSRQIITFVISALLIGLFLYIPIQSRHGNLQHDSLLSVILIKPTVKVENVTIKETPITVNKVPNSKPVIKPEIKPITNPIIPPTISKIIHVKPQVNKAQPKLPSAGVILNSLQYRKPLQQVTQDFQTASQNNDFKYRKIVKKEIPLLIVDETLVDDMVNIKTPMALKAFKGFVGFLITPMDDPVKTKDTLIYCMALGRKSVFCPNANPLLN